jgi:Ca2+-binding RTX toxin-like protein
MAFQTLVIVLAPTASAAATCTFASGTITIEMAPDDLVALGQNDVTDTIQFDDGADGTFAECAPVAPIATTTSIVVNGDIGDETVEITMSDVAAGDNDLVNWGAVNWSINAGTDVLDNDFLHVDGSLVDSGDMNVVFGASGIDLNGDGDLDVTHAGFEDFEADGGAGEDTISGAGSTATGAAFASNLIDVDGGAEDDTLTGGAGNDTFFGDAGDDILAGGLGDDSLTGGANGADGDTADFSGSAAAVNANLTSGNASGQGLDTLVTLENLIGSPQGDTLTGDGAVNVITPGAGNDILDGAGLDDTVDYGDATAAVTVDLAANTSTGGSGNDTLTSIEDVWGSGFDDTFNDQTNQDNEYFGDSGSDTFNQGAEPAAGTEDEDLVDGEGGTDTVDYSLRTDGLQIDLDEEDDTSDGTCDDDSGDIDDGEDDFIDNVENAVGGSGDDVICGSAFGNIVNPGGGQNVLEGNSGSDTLDYSSSTEGVEVNMAGGATAGDSATEFENVKGSDFADRITGDGLSNTIRGRGGNDNVRAGGGDDTVRGGAGNDILRTGGGDDDAFGGKGNDTIRGGPGVDFCKGGPGRDSVKGCELGRA